MVIAHHLIFSAYGFWLPNDPRGSWSTWIRHWEIARFGPATKVDTRRSVAGAAHDHAERLAAKAALMYPAVVFNGEQARAIARGFALAVEESRYAVYACAILPEHTHMVVARHAHSAEEMAAHFKGRATRQLNAEGLHPLQGHVTKDGETPSPWSVGPWKVFIDDAEHLCAAIAYVGKNPLKEGKRRQSWRFVTPYAAPG